MFVDYVGAHLLTSLPPTGLPPTGDGDGNLLRLDRPSAVHMAPQAVYVHLGKSYNRKGAIWNEGNGHLLLRFMASLTLVRLHSSSFSFCSLTA